MLRLLLLIFILMISHASFGEELKNKHAELHAVFKYNINTDLHKPIDAWFGKDKAKHFLASMIITGSSMWVAKHRWGTDRAASRTFGISVGISAGFAKEFLDRGGKTAHFSWRDLVADFFGILIGGTLLAW